MKQLVVLISCMVFTVLHADPWDDFSVGTSRSITQDTLSVKSQNDPFSAGSNPARFAEQDYFAASVMVLISSLGAEVDEAPTSTFAAMALQKYWQHWMIGGQLFAPVDQGAFYDTGDSRLTVSPWTHRMRHFQGQILFGRKLNAWKFGLSLPIILATESNADLLLANPEPNTRLQAAIKPSVSVKIGVDYQLSERIALSAFYRHKQNVASEVQLVGSIPAGGPVIQLDAFGKSHYLFEPARFGLQGSIDMSPALSMGILFRYALWSKMPSPYLDLIYSQPPLPRASIDFSADDSLDVNLGFSYKLKGRWTLMGAYRFQQSPFTKLEQFYFDDNQHILSLGPVFQVDDHVVSANYRFHLLENGNSYHWTSMGYAYKY